MCLEYVSNTPIETFDHPIGLRSAWLDQAMFDTEFLAQLVKLMIATGITFTAGKQSVSKFLAVVCQNTGNPDRTGIVQRLQKCSGAGCGFVRFDGHIHPTCGSVYCYQQVAPAVFILHLRQLFDVDME